MNRLAFLLLLAACSCSSVPLVPDAQSIVDHLRADFRAAQLSEERYETLLPCPARPPCQDVRLADDAHRAMYVAAHSLVVADTERTRPALEAARRDVSYFVVLTGVLR